MKGTVLENFIVLISKKCTYFGLPSLSYLIFSNNILSCISSVHWWKEQPSWKVNSTFAVSKSEHRPQLSRDAQSNFNERGVDGKYRFWWKI